MTALPQCSFCGCRKGDRSIGGEVFRVVMGPTVNICDICVGLCQEVIDDGAEDPIMPTPATPPAFDEPLGAEDDLQELAEAAEPPEQVAEPVAPPSPPPPSSRIESGVVRFGDDWPGVFLRGDDALGYGTSLKNMLQSEIVRRACTVYEIDALEGLRDALMACDQAVAKPLELRSAEQCREPLPIPDAKAARIVERLERAVAELRKRGATSPSDGYVLRDLAIEAGYKEPKPGLEKDELAAVVRLARAAPTADVEAYVAQLRGDVAAWAKASRKPADLGWASLLTGALAGMGAYWAMKGFGGKK